MIFVYRTLHTLTLLLCSPWLIWRLWRKGGFHAGSGGRFGIVRKVPLKSQRVKRIWIQAVSVGELLSLEPLLRKFKADPDFEIVLTTTSASGYQLMLHRYRDLVAWAGVFPLDAWITSNGAWRVLQPDLVVLMESELWPEHLHQAGIRGVPVCLLNARMSAFSLRFHQRLSRYSQSLFRPVSLIIVPHVEDQQQFKALGWIAPEKVIHGGNLKMDFRPEADLAPPQRSQLLSELGFHSARRPFVLLGSSTWSADEAALLDCFSKLHPAHPDLRLLLVPRHPVRKSSIANVIKCRELQAHFLSDGPCPAAGSLITIADSIGELTGWTALADVVVIGKSFPPHRGGQSPVLAAALAKPILWGPHMDNFRSICAELIRHNAAIAVADARSLADVIEPLLADHERLANMGSAARKFVESQRGASDFAISRIRSLCAAATDHPSAKPTATCHRQSAD